MPPRQRECATVVGVIAHVIRQSCPAVERAKPHRPPQPLPEQHRSKDRTLPIFDVAASAALLDDLTAIAARATAAVRQAGRAPPRQKMDGSPVTAADEAAEAVILEGIEALVPGISIVSEEQSAREKPRVPIAQKESYFLVDPLDGTREFIAGRDEYTINIALISAGAPILGIIAAPAADITWRGIVGRGADRISLSGKSRPTAIRTRPRPGNPVIMVSRSHLDAHTKAYLVKLQHTSPTAAGSSIKFCRIAEGAADLYPRLAPTHDWDVAAGHAIVAAAGGDVRAADGSALIYGTPKRLIADFIARGDPSKD
jgi:3'(2'), 5'-bisphosphate nucleotidase